MKNLLAICLSVIFFATAQLSASETVTILHLGDTHSCLTPSGPRDAELKGLNGGAARAATIIGMEKMQDPNAILLHSGDIFIGNLFFNKYFGVPELSILKQLGCDALTLGNHEFDLTPEALTLSLQAAFVEGGFPVLSTNFETFDNPDLETLASFISPYTILERNGLRIGVFGLTTPETNLLSNPAPVFLDTLIVERATATVMELQEQNCDLIIMSSHLGMKYDEAVAYYVSGIDLVIGGHDHFAWDEMQSLPNMYGSSTPYVQSGAFYQNIGKTQVTVDNGEVISVDFELIALDETVPEEPSIKVALAAPIAGIEETYGPLFSQQCAVATADFEEVCHPEFKGVEYLDTHVGNLICDAFLAYGETDISIQPGGCTAQKLFRGPLTGEDIFRMIGYGFNEANGLGYRMAKYKLTGASLIFGLEYGLSDIESNDEFLLQIGGMKYFCNLNKNPFERVIQATVNGKKIDPEKEYTVTSNEFVVMFLDILGIPYSDLEIEEELTEFQVVLNYVSTLQEITPQEKGRIKSPVKEVKYQNIIKNIKFFPNPCQDAITMNFKIAKPGYYTIAVYSHSGELLIQIPTEYFGEGYHTNAISVNGLLRGIYLVKITGENASISRVFIKK